MFGVSLRHGRAGQQNHQEDDEVSSWISTIIQLYFCWSDRLLDNDRAGFKTPYYYIFITPYILCSYSNQPYIWSTYLRKITFMCQIDFAERDSIFKIQIIFFRRLFEKHTVWNSKMHIWGHRGFWEVRILWI